MLSQRLIVSIPLLLSILPSYGLSEPLNPTIDNGDAAADVEVFQRLLNQVDPPALHSLLHEYSPKKFKHGMFMEDRIAVEAIHRDDPPLAASIVSLAKRQGGNGTVSTPVSPSVPATSNPDQTSTSPPPDDASATTTLGSDAASPTVSSTDDQQSTPTDQSVSTSTPSSGVIETSSRSAGSVFTITHSYGVVIVTTAGGGASTISTGSVPPSTTNPSSTISATASITTSKSSRTSTVVHTSTLPNGSKSIVTAITVVPEAAAPTPTGGAGATDGTGTGTAATPGLQTVNGGAVRTGSVLKEMLCVVGGAVGVAMLM